MKGENLVSAFGVAAETMTALAKLARQAKKQGGREDDVRLLENDRILQRVALVLARAGNLSRELKINATGGFEGWINVFLLQFNLASITDSDRAVKSWKCRLLTKAELDALWQGYPNLLQFEDELVIVGENIESIGQNSKHWVMTKAGVETRYIPLDEAIGENFRFAAAFVS